jgi:GNAT superfamily N-acetyltransferase
MADVKIQPATLQNLKDIQKLNHWMCIRENEEFDSTISRDYPIKEAGEKYFKERILNDCALIASKDKKVVGYLVGAVSKAEDYRTITKIAEAENMVVLDEFRGLGIGKLLLEEFTKWAISKKVDMLRVVATAQNTGAIKFYKREGFVEKSVTFEKEV